MILQMLKNIAHLKDDGKLLQLLIKIIREIIYNFRFLNILFFIIFFNEKYEKYLNLWKLETN